MCSVVADFLQPLDCSPPGSSVHGILQARIKNTRMGCHFLQEIFPTQGSNLHLLHFLFLSLFNLLSRNLENPYTLTEL